MTIHSTFLATAAIALIAFNAQAQIGAARIDDNARPPAANKSINPNTGEAGFKKDLQDAKDRKFKAEIGEGSDEAKMLGKDSAKQLGAAEKPEIAGENEAADSLKKREEDKKKHGMCNITCGVYKAPSTSSKTPQQIDPLKWGKNSEEKTQKPSKEEIEAKKQKAYDDCMKSCMTK